MPEVRDVFVGSLPQITDAIKNGEYMRGGTITTNLGQVATQLEHKHEVFVANILDNTCFQLHQATVMHNVPRTVVDKINVDIVNQMTALIAAYSNKESVCEMLQEILYRVTRFMIEVQQTYPPRRSQSKE